MTARPSSTEAARQALERRVAWLLDHPRNIRQSDRDEVRDGFAALRERPSDAALVEALRRIRDRDVNAKRAEARAWDYEQIAAAALAAARPDAEPKA